MLGINIKIDIFIFFCNYLFILLIFINFIRLAIYCSDKYLQYYEKVNPEILTKQNKVKYQVSGNIVIEPSAKISDSAKIGPNVYIGPNSIIGKGVRIHDAIILNDVVIKVIIIKIKIKIKKID